MVRGDRAQLSNDVAPVVIAQKCVGCGLCQTRCYGINVLDKHLLNESAIIIRAGEGKEDRLHSGSYIALRTAEEQERATKRKQSTPATGDSYLPDFLQKLMRVERARSAREPRG